MEDTIKVRKIERKKARIECLNFLRDAGANDAYLFEGIAYTGVRFHNYCFVQDGRIIGVVHSKTGSSVHLFFSERVSEACMHGAIRFVGKRFPGPKILFGDTASIREFEKYSGESMSVKHFNSMEIYRSWLRPRLLYRAITPTPDMAALLLPLQVQYEIEEVGAQVSEINRSRVLAVLKRKMGRGEISSIFDGRIPVAMAGLNARFEDICQIGSVFVVPNRRGEGFGISVLSYHLLQLFTRYKRILLFVNTKNRPAYSMYRKLGFRDTGTLVQATVAQSRQQTPAD